MCWSYLFAYLTFIFKTFLKDTLHKQRDSGEFIEIDTNDIFSQALGTLEYSSYVRARGHDVRIREFFSKPQGGLRSIQDR